MTSAAVPHRKSLRKRLMWAFSSLTTLVLLAQAVALFVASEEQEEDLIDEVVNTALDGVTTHNPAIQNHVLAPNIVLYRAPLNSVPAGLPTPLLPLPSGNHEWYSGDTEYHVGIRDYAGERFYLLYDTTEHEERMAYLLWALIVGGIIIALLSLWLGYWIAGALLSQLETLAVRLTEDAPRPLVEPGQDREVALLASALDDYRAHNAALMAREQAFTANVSHELRTPLTRIRTSAELLAEGLVDHERALRIVHAVDDLDLRLKSLLFLARGSGEVLPSTVALYGLVASLVEHYRDACHARGLVLENQVSPAVCVQADPALLSLLLDNLLRNAVRYTVAGQITIHFEHDWLSVNDTGIGIPEDKLHQVFDRHFRISDLPDGMGLGLAIVREVADRCGWTCELHSTLGQGTQVRIKLSA